MKLKAILLYNLLFLGLMPAQDWTYFIDQRHLENNGFIRTEVDAKGNMISEMAIPEGGSEFTIWAKENRASSAPILHQVGVDTVGAYLPEGELRITTPDPYSGGIPRTRVDQGFTLHGNVEGLETPGEDVPLAAQKVLLDHRVELFEYRDETLTSLSASELFEQSFVEENGSFEESYLGNVPGNDVFTECAVETFTLYALPDGEIAQLELAEAQVQIWPLARATSSGAESGETYRIIPDITFNLKNLYPKSETYLRYYFGPESTESEGTRVLDVQIVIDQDVPRDGTLVLESAERFFDRSGIWTIEVLTDTPFGTERLDFVELNYQTDLYIRGSINTLN